MSCSPNTFPRIHNKTQTMDEPVMEEDTNIETKLLPCGHCGRTFLPASFAKHHVVCERNATRKRKVFNSLKQRVEGTDLALFHQPAFLKRHDSTTTLELPLRPNKWKEKHLELVSTIRAARGEPSEMSVTPKRSAASVNSSASERCPSCDRNFGPKAYDRHVEWCKEHKSRIQKSPANVLMAKERLEARIRYQVPQMNKSKRSVIREKYSTGTNRTDSLLSLKSVSSVNLERSPSVRKPKVDVKTKQVCASGGDSVERRARGDSRREKSVPKETNVQPVIDGLKSPRPKRVMRGFKLNRTDINTGNEEMTVCRALFKQLKNPKDSKKLVTWKDTVHIPTPNMMDSNLLATFGIKKKLTHNEMQVAAENVIEVQYSEDSLQKFSAGEPMPEKSKINVLDDKCVEEGAETLCNILQRSTKVPGIDVNERKTFYFGTSNTTFLQSASLQITSGFGKTCTAETNLSAKSIDDKKHECLEEPVPVLDSTPVLHHFQDSLKPIPDSTSVVELLEKRECEISDMDSLDGSHTDVWNNALVCSRIDLSARKCCSDTHLYAPSKSSFVSYTETDLDKIPRHEVLQNYGVFDEDGASLSSYQILELASEEFLSVVNSNEAALTKDGLKCFKEQSREKIASGRKLSEQSMNPLVEITSSRCSHIQNMVKDDTNMSLKESCASDKASVDEENRLFMKCKASTSWNDTNSLLTESDSDLDGHMHIPSYTTLECARDMSEMTWRTDRESIVYTNTHDVRRSASTELGNKCLKKIHLAPEVERNWDTTPVKCIPNMQYLDDLTNYNSSLEFLNAKKSLCARSCSNATLTKSTSSGEPDGNGKILLTKCKSWRDLRNDPKLITKSNSSSENGDDARDHANVILMRCNTNSISPDGDNLFVMKPVLIDGILEDSPLALKELSENSTNVPMLDGEINFKSIDLCKALFVERGFENVAKCVENPNKNQNAYIQNEEVNATQDKRGKTIAEKVMFVEESVSDMIVFEESSTEDHKAGNVEELSCDLSVLVSKTDSEAPSTSKNNLVESELGLQNDKACKEGYFTFANKLGTRENRPRLVQFHGTPLGIPEKRRKLNSSTNSEISSSSTFNMVYSRALCNNIQKIKARKFDADCLFADQNDCKLFRQLSKEFDEDRYSSDAASNNREVNVSEHGTKIGTEQHHLISFDSSDGKLVGQNLFFCPERLSTLQDCNTGGSSNSSSVCAMEETNRSNQGLFFPGKSRHLLMRKHRERKMKKFGKSEETLDVLLANKVEHEESIHSPTLLTGTEVHAPPLDNKHTDKSINSNSCEKIKIFQNVNQQSSQTSLNSQEITPRFLTLLKTIIIPETDTCDASKLVDGKNSSAENFLSISKQHCRKLVNLDARLLPEILHNSAVKVLGKKIKTRCASSESLRLPKIMNEAQFQQEDDRVRTVRSKLTLPAVKGARKVNSISRIPVANDFAIQKAEGSKMASDIYDSAKNAKNDCHEKDDYNPFLSAERQLMELLHCDDFKPFTSKIAAQRRPHTTATSKPKQTDIHKNIKNKSVKSADKKTTHTTTITKRASVIDPPGDFQDQISLSNEDFEQLESLVNQNFCDSDGSLGKDNISSFFHPNNNGYSAYDNQKYSDDMASIDPRLINKNDNLSFPEHLPTHDRSPTSSIENNPLLSKNFRNKNYSDDVDHYSMQYDHKISALETLIFPKSEQKDIKRSVSLANKTDSIDDDFLLDSFSPPYNKLQRSPRIAKGVKQASKSLRMVSPGKVPKKTVQKSMVSLHSSFGSARNTANVDKKNKNILALKRSASLFDPVLKPKNLRNKQDVENYFDEQERRSPTKMVETEKECTQSPRKEANVVPLTPKAEELFSVDDEMYEEYKKYEELYLREKQLQKQEEKLKHDEIQSSGTLTPNDNYDAAQGSNKINVDSAYSSLNRTTPKIRARSTKLAPLEHQPSTRVESPSSSGSEMSPTLSSRRGLGQRVSKFCHECGNRYPINTAKFCVECGIKRLVL